MLIVATSNKRLCPHLKEPFDECYCVKMSSQDIERAVYLCSKNFETCDIYKNGNGNGNGHNKPNGNGHDHKSLLC
jgi:hypothetical protein